MPVLAFERLLTLAIFAGAYVGLALGRLPGFRVDRTGVAIIGGALVVVVAGVAHLGARPSPRVDAHTLVLLFGMMIVAAYLRLSGFFGLVTCGRSAARKARVGLLAPDHRRGGRALRAVRQRRDLPGAGALVLDLTRQLRLPPVPYLIALATAANVGSVATLTGNPQNMLVGSFSGISYRGFLVREAPVAVLGLACVFGVVWLVYRRQLPDALPAADREDRHAVHYPLMIKTLAAVGGHAGGVPGRRADRAWWPSAGAAYTLLTRRVNPEKVYREIDWALLVLFTGLFVVIGAVEETGLAARGARLGLRGRAAPAGRAHGGDRGALQPGLQRAGGAALQERDPDASASPIRAWLLLAMASTLAGNLTILGSVANLIVVEQARGAGIQVGFLEYSKVGVPITVLTLLVGWLLLVLVPV